MTSSSSSTSSAEMGREEIVNWLLEIAKTSKSSNDMLQSTIYWLSNAPDPDVADFVIYRLAKFRPQIDAYMQNFALLKEGSPEQEQAAEIGTKEIRRIIKASLCLRHSLYYPGKSAVERIGAQLAVMSVAELEEVVPGEYHGRDMNMMRMMGMEEVFAHGDFSHHGRDMHMMGVTKGTEEVPAHVVEFELDEEGLGASPGTFSSFSVRFPEWLVVCSPFRMGRRNYDDIEMQMNQPMVVTGASSDGNEENPKAYVTSLLSASSLSGLAAGATVLGFATSVSGHLLRRVHPPTARIMSKVGFMFLCFGVLEMLRKNLPDNLQWISWAASAELLILFLATEIFF